MNKNRFILSTPILFFGLLFFSLVSLTIYAWSLGLLLVGLFALLEKVQINKKALKESFLLIVLLIFAIFRFQLFLINQVLPVFSVAFWGNASILVLCVIAWLFLRSITLDKKNYMLIKILPKLLWVHVIAFYVQTVIFLLSGFYLDFVEPFTGIKSRFDTFIQLPISGVGSFRPTGLLVEPSTYFFVVLVFAALIVINKDFQKNRLLLILTIASMYLSFSTAAVIIATIFVIYLFFVQKVRLFYYSIFLILGLGILFSSGSSIVKLYLFQQDKFDETSDLRENLVSKVYNRDIENELFAFGPFAIDKDIARSTTGIGNSTIASINDSGMMVFLWLEFGYFGVFLFLWLCYKQSRFGVKQLILFIIISLTKLNPFTPFFILFWGISIRKKQYELIDDKQLNKLKLNYYSLKKDY